MKYRRYRTTARGSRVAALLAVVLATLVAVGAGTQALGSRQRGETGRFVAGGVTVAGVDLSGLTASEATAALTDVFDRPLSLRHRGRTLRFMPESFGGRAQVALAVRQALAAAEGAKLRLPVDVDGRRLRAGVRALARNFDRPAKNARIVLRGLRPRIVRERVGRRVDLLAAQMRVAAALRSGERSVALPVRRVRPRVTRARVGPAIVVRRDSNRLFLYRGGGHRRGMRLVRSLGVATGQPVYPTPLGNFTIATKQRDPWWYPPDSDWAAGAAPIPPGPGNPLGTRWMGLSEPLIGIHGTPDAASIGYSASHGCIRMHIADAEWLFERIAVGTPVFILAA